jgi:hypothetical protein
MKKASIERKPTENHSNSQLDILIREMSAKDSSYFKPGTRIRDVSFTKQLERPDFTKYAPSIRPHDNRFQNINLDTTAASKNPRQKQLDFSKGLARDNKQF